MAHQPPSIHLVNDKLSHEAAIKRIESIIEEDNDALDPELEALALLVENYEKKTIPFEDPDPIEILKFRMRQIDLNTSKLAEILEIGRGRASELLNRRRRLTLDLIRRIGARLDIAPGLLVSEYPLDNEDERA